MSFTNIAIIGANGFIGKQLTEVLAEQANLKISLFGRNDSKEFAGNLPYYKFDLNNTQQIETYFKEIELVYYLASEAIPSSSRDDPKFDVEKNLLPFINFLNCTSKLKLKKIVFVSSAGTIYGPSTEKLTEESDKKPFSPYGITKLAMENYLNYFEARYHVYHDVFRVSNVYGIGQNTSKGLGIINTFLEKIITENSVLIYGNGEIVRNYIYVNDVAKLLSFSVTENSNESHIFNLASNDNLSINSLVNIVESIVKEKFTKNYKEIRQSDNPAISLDNSKIKAAFPNYKFSSIEEGIEGTYDYLKKKHSVKNN